MFIPVFFNDKKNMTLLYKLQFSLFFQIMIALLVTNGGICQSTTLKAVDSIYVDNIRSLKWVAGGAPYGLAAMPLKGGFMTLTFDNMEGDIKNYVYTIEQYDRDWQSLTKLDKMEYTEGYQEDRIVNIKNAQATNIPFVHYRLTFPNENMRVTKSGNYLLKVLDEDDDKKVVFTRRFVVYETLLVPIIQPAIPNALLYNTHHELDIVIEPKNFRISNPMNEVQLSVLQNRRWDVVKNNIRPLFVQGEKLVFDYQDSVVFLAGKEWRYVDLRSTRFRSERVARIDKDDETWFYTLRPDLDRSREPYLVYPDLNGGYFIQNTDFDSELESDTKADYVDVVFTLIQKQPIEDADVYLFGELTDWKIDERFKLDYAAAQQRYEATVQLKQGFYNYIYITVPKNGKSYNASALEGDWYETQNEYTVLVYYRPFGARFDRIIGISKYLSNRR